MYDRSFDGIGPPKPLACALVEMLQLSQFITGGSDDSARYWN
jgi:hypothetical protein